MRRWDGSARRMRKPILLNRALDSRARLETSRDTTGAINLPPAKFTTEAQRSNENAWRGTLSICFSVSLCLCGEFHLPTYQTPCATCPHHAICRRGAFLRSSRVGDSHSVTG